jgi:hypothetical protein
MNNNKDIPAVYPTGGELSKLSFEDCDVPLGYVTDPAPRELNNKTVDMLGCLVFGGGGGAGVIVRGRSDIKTR